MQRTAAMIPGKPFIKILICCIAYSCFLLTSCEKEFSYENNQTGNVIINQPPVAHAGADQIILLPADSVQLNGSLSSDPDGAINSVIWSKIAGPTATLLHSTSLLAVAKDLTEGLYHFELNVTDNDGLSSKDTVKVRVDDPAQNQPPTANAGTDQTITLPVNSITLNGTASSDPDQNISSYQWIKIDGPSSYTISNAAAVQTTVTNLVQGNYYFQLMVTDAQGLFSKDTVQVHVETQVQINCFYQESLLGSTGLDVWGYQSVLAGNKIIIAGGFKQNAITGSIPSGQVAILDLSTQSWTNFSLDHGGNLAMIAYGEKVMIAGGVQLASNNTRSSKADIYNSATNTWTSTQLTEARDGLTAVRAGNKLIFSGGSNGTISSSMVDVYDITTEKWTSKDLGHYIANTGASNDIVVFSGNPAGIDIYNAGSNNWSTSLHSMDQYAMTVAWSASKFFFAGGFHGMNNGYEYSDRAHIYDHASGTWSQTTLSQPRAEARSIGTSNKIFWFGGYDSTWLEGTQQIIRPVTDIEIYDINSGSRTHYTWPGNPYHCGRTNNHVLFYEQPGKLHIYNLISGEWTVCNNANLGTAPIFIWKENSAYVVSTINSSPSTVKVWKLDF